MNKGINLSNVKAYVSKNNNMFQTQLKNTAHQHNTITLTIKHHVLTSTEVHVIDGTKSQGLTQKKQCPV